MPICPQHGEMTLQPAGISKKTGKSYSAFWKCSGTNPDGSYCTFKPNVTPTPTQTFSASLDKDNKEEQIQWLNAKNVAAQIMQGTPWNVERFKLIVTEIYNVKNGQ